MKTAGVGFVILLGLLSFAFSNQGWSQVLETAEQHLKQAESYRELAEWQRQDIAGYKKEKGNFLKRSETSGSIQVEASLKEYNDLIAEDEALLADFKILEDWHRRRAKELEGVKTSIYGKVLHAYVTHGRVDYSKLKHERQDLDEYVKSLESLSRENYEEMSRDEKIAFWINAYNAAAVKLIIDHYPLRKRFGWKALTYPENSIQQIPNVWDREVLEAFGEKQSLNHIEHKILRKEFQEPRIHLALVCASLGCPLLRDEPYEGTKLNAQLEDQVRNFLLDSKKVRYDEQTDTLYLSPIFKWFRSDFESTGGVIAFVKTHWPNETKEKISEKTKIEWLHYDWGLNEKEINR